MAALDQLPQQITAHALQIGDRINTAGFEGEVLSSTPLALHVGVSGGLAVVFRYGAVVLLGRGQVDLEPETFQETTNRARVAQAQRDQRDLVAREPGGGG